MLVDAGWPRMAARVFAFILTGDDARFTAGELAAGLQVSPAAVSGAVRLLVRLGLVDRERDPGSRRDHYRIPDDVWFHVVEQRSAELARWGQLLAEGAALLGPNRPAGRRLLETKEFFEFTRAELPRMIERWHEHQAARGDAT